MKYNEIIDNIISIKKEFWAWKKKKKKKKKKKIKIYNLQFTIYN